MNPPERSKYQGFGRKILFVILLIGLTVGFIFGQRGLLNWNKMRRQVAEMEYRNDSLQREISILSLRIRALESLDSLELERAARSWGMSRPGEELYIIKDESADSGKTSPQPAAK